MGNDEHPYKGIACYPYKGVGAYPCMGKFKSIIYRLTNETIFRFKFIIVKILLIYHISTFYYF